MLDLPMPATPIVLALASSLCFATGIQFTRLGLRRCDSQSGTLLNIGVAMVIYWLLAPWFVESHYWLSPATLLFAAIGVFRPFLSTNLAMAATARVGPTISSTLSATAPLFGLGFGILVLGEVVTPGIALGTAAIVCGVIALSWSSGRAGVARDWPLWALALPVGAAVIRILAQGFAKVGMESLPSPLFVGLVSYTVSYLVAVANAGRRGQRAARIWTVPGAYWFYISGAIYAAAIFLLNSALHAGELVVVSPVMACQPLFSLLLGYLVFREASLNARVASAVVAVVLGVVVIALRSV